MLANKHTDTVITILGSPIGGRVTNSSHSATGTFHAPVLFSELRQ